MLKIKVATWLGTILAVGIGLFGYSTTNKKTAVAEEKPTVVASYSVLCDLIETVAEDTIDLTCLIDSTQNPHTYSPTPSELEVIEQAQLIFYGGYQFEPKLIELIEGTETNQIAVHEAVVTEPIMVMNEHQSEEPKPEPEANKPEAQAKEPKSEPDPHIWHDVKNAIAMVELIQSLLVQLNPSQAAVYLTNSSSLISQLGQLDIWIDKQIATIPEGQRILVTIHAALNYYVRAYDLEDYKTLQGISPDPSTTTEQLRKLAAEIKETNIPIIFAEVPKRDRLIKAIAREANVKVADQELLTDGLGEARTPRDTYIRMMESNTCAIANGLGGECKPFEPN